MRIHKCCYSIQITWGWCLINSRGESLVVQLKQQQNARWRCVCPLPHLYLSLFSVNLYNVNHTYFWVPLVVCENAYQFTGLNRSFRKFKCKYSNESFIIVAYLPNFFPFAFSINPFCANLNPEQS